MVLMVLDRDPEKILLSGHAILNSCLTVNFAAVYSSHIWLCYSPSFTKECAWLSITLAAHSILQVSPKSMISLIFQARKACHFPQPKPWPILG